jgi:hypothetical protein
MAAAIQEKQVLDMPLSRTFFKALSLRSILPNDLLYVDGCIARSALQLLALSTQAEIFARAKFPQCDDAVERLNESELKQCTLDGVPVEQLCLEFPDGSQWRGEDVRLANLGRFVYALANDEARTSVSKELSAVRRGFSGLLNPKALEIFSGEGEFVVQHLCFSFSFHALEARPFVRIPR